MGMEWNWWHALIREFLSLGYICVEAWIDEEKTMQLSGVIIGSIIAVWRIEKNPLWLKLSEWGRLLVEDDMKERSGVIVCHGKSFGFNWDWD